MRIEIQKYGFLILLIGIMLLILYIWINKEWLQYVSIVLIVAGGLLINYKNILRKR